MSILRRFLMHYRLDKRLQQLTAGKERLPVRGRPTLCLVRLWRGFQQARQFRIVPSPLVGISRAQSTGSHPPPEGDSPSVSCVPRSNRRTRNVSIPLGTDTDSIEEPQNRRIGRQTWLKARVFEKPHSIGPRFSCDIVFDSILFSGIVSHFSGSVHVREAVRCNETKERFHRGR